MKYWDSSALVPLVLKESATSRVDPVWQEDPRLVTWAWTVVEATSAIERRTRDGSLNPQQRQAALDRLDRLGRSWTEITDLAAVRRRARRLLGRHALRAADAGQLAAALLAAEVSGASLDFVCLDVCLAEAAQREGLRALP